ncbi:MAG: hypothetical protein ACRC33_14305 [Gemmataceae bacterium]
MTWTEAPLTLSEPASGGRSVALSPGSDHRWQEVITGQLAAWERDPGSLADDDIEPPTAAVIRLAAQVARAASEAGSPPPTRVVVDGAGGIAFERVVGSEYETLLVRKDGSVEMLAFRGATLLSRRKLREAGECG